MKKFLNEFKTFAMRGNVLDMAVGVIIGSAFTAIVNSLVADVFTPIIGMITGGVDFSGLSVGIGSAQIMYGNFINAVISFILVAFCVFLLVKAMNKLTKKDEKEAEKKAAEEKKKAEEAAKAAEPSAEEKLLAEIRDLLKAQNK